MVDLSKLLNKDTFIISDTHFGHKNVLLFEPLRLEYLIDYDDSVLDEGNLLLDLIKQYQYEELKSIKEVDELLELLSPKHDEMLIEKWNSVIGANDTVLHLGDFAFRNINGYTSKLNGNKILLRGNHDYKSDGTYFKAGWKDVISQVRLIVDNSTYIKYPSDNIYMNAIVKLIEFGEDYLTILFSHYPLFDNNEWNMKKFGYITDALEEVFSDFQCDANIHGHTHSSNASDSRCLNVSLETCPWLMPLKIEDLIKNKKVFEQGITEQIDDETPF